MGWLDLADRTLSAARRPFLEPVTFTPSGGAPEYLRGVFDPPGAAVDIQGVTLSTTSPEVELRISDLSRAPAQGDGIVVRSVSYTVVDDELDGHGGVLLQLHET